MRVARWVMSVVLMITSLPIQKVHAQSVSVETKAWQIDWNSIPQTAFKAIDTNDEHLATITLDTGDALRVREIGILAKREGVEQIKIKADADGISYARKVSGTNKTIQRRYTHQQMNQIYQYILVQKKPAVALPEFDILDLIIMNANVPNTTDLLQAGFGESLNDVVRTVEDANAGAGFWGQLEPKTTISADIKITPEQTGILYLLSITEEFQKMQNTIQRGHLGSAGQARYDFLMLYSFGSQVQTMQKLNNIMGRNEKALSAYTQGVASNILEQMLHNNLDAAAAKNLTESVLGGELTDGAAFRAIEAFMAASDGTVNDADLAQLQSLRRGYAKIYQDIFSDGMRQACGLTVKESKKDNEALFCEPNGQKLHDNISEYFKATRKIEHLRGSRLTLAAGMLAMVGGVFAMAIGESYNASLIVPGLIVEVLGIVAGITGYVWNVKASANHRVSPLHKLGFDRGKALIESMNGNPENTARRMTRHWLNCGNLLKPTFQP